MAYGATVLLRGIPGTAPAFRNRVPPGYCFCADGHFVPAAAISVRGCHPDASRSTTPEGFGEVNSRGITIVPPDRRFSPSPHPHPGLGISGAFHGTGRALCFYGANDQYRSELRRPYNRKSFAANALHNRSAVGSETYFRNGLIRANTDKTVLVTEKCVAGTLVRCGRRTVASPFYKFGAVVSGFPWRTRFEPRYSGVRDTTAECTPVQSRTCSQAAYGFRCAFSERSRSKTFARLTVAAAPYHRAYRARPANSSAGGKSRRNGRSGASIRDGPVFAFVENGTAIASLTCCENDEHVPLLPLTPSTRGATRFRDVRRARRNDGSRPQ